MLTYWLMFLLPAMVALMTETQRTRALAGGESETPVGAWIAVGIVLTLLIGFRYEVGGDWFSYVFILDDVAGAMLDEVFLMSDPGYQLLNWLSLELDWDIFGVNLMAGAIFAIGLVVFCRNLPRPWLALAVAVPYLVIVVAMGYSRQGVALGLAMLGLVALGKKGTGWFVFWVLLAATFHKTAVLLLPLAALAAAQNRFVAIAWGVGSLALGYWLFLEDSVEKLYVNYVEAEYQSSGAMIRLAMNLVPSVILLVWGKKFTFSDAERRLWLLFAIISLALLGVFLASPASTAIDRIALYMLPLQLVVFAHAPDALGEESDADVSVPVLGVVAYYALVQFVWLNFADHAYCVAALSFLSPGSHVLKVVLFANTEWYLYNFRRSLASALRDAGHEVLLLSPPGPYGEKLRALGFRWLPAPMERRSLNPLRELALVNWLRGLIRDEQVDLVHGFTIKCAVYGSLAARLAGVPARVNAVAGMGYVFSSNDLKAKALRPLVRAMMHVALGGQVGAADPAESGRRGLFPAGARGRSGDDSPDSRFGGGLPPLCAGCGAPARRTLSRAAGRRGCCGTRALRNMSRRRAACMRQRRAIDFLLAGDPDPGNPAAVPEAQIRGWVDEGLLQWLGHVDDMPALFASVDAVVLPSYREGLPKGLIEAGASGLPLVTTDVPGCREVVTDGVDGLLVQVRDAATLAAAIARLHDDPALCERLGRAAREKALAEFDERIVLDKTLAVYAELV